MKNLAPIHAVIPKGSLDSTSTATVMTATVPGIDALFNGVCVWLTNGVITSASNFTININGLGAKPVYQSQAAATRSTTIFNINYTALLIYNEDRVSDGCWDYVYGYDSNTNTIAYQVRTQSVALPMDSVTYRYRLLFQSVDGKRFVPANNSTSTNATASRTVNQTPIDPFGLIIYYGTTASVAAGSKPNSSYMWQQYNDISLGYSFNMTGAALTLTTSEPVYLKCAPQSNGSAIIDDTTPYVQSLPSSDDGKIYIFLGIAASATAIMLTLEHPVYWYKNGAVRQWTNSYVAVPTKTSDLTNDSGFITGLYIADYGTSTFAEVEAAYQANTIVYCRKSDRMAFLAYVQSSGNEFEFQYYRSVATHTDAQQGDQVYIYKLNRSGGWSESVREAYTKIATGTGLSKSYSNGTLTLNADSQLPAVTSSDNGKVLMVVNGVWAAASLPVYNGGVS